jgi:hypothetical protein
MMHLLTAARPEDLVRELAEQCVRLGRLGAVLEHVEYREELEPGTDTAPAYFRCEAVIYYRWANIDEPTHTRRIAAGGGS